jgi:hypothetical protein
VVSCTYGRGDKALQECNLSTWPSLDCIEASSPDRSNCRPGFCLDGLQAKAQSEKLILTAERSELIELVG